MKQRYHRAGRGNTAACRGVGFRQGKDERRRGGGSYPTGRRGKHKRDHPSKSRKYTQNQSRATTQQGTNNKPPTVLSRQSRVDRLHACTHLSLVCRRHHQKTHEYTIERSNRNQGRNQNPQRRTRTRAEPTHLPDQGGHDRKARVHVSLGHDSHEHHAHAEAGRCALLRDLDVRGRHSLPVVDVVFITIVIIGGIALLLLSGGIVLLLLFKYVARV